MTEKFPILRRAIIIIGLKDPFIEWIFNVREAHYGRGQTSLENIKERAARKKNAYLIPPQRLCNPDAFVRENAAAIFENELSDWCLRKELWPSDRSWDVFRKWLGYESRPLVYDASPETGIEYEEIP